MPRPQPWRANHTQLDRLQQAQEDRDRQLARFRQETQPVPEPGRPSMSPADLPPEMSHPVPTPDNPLAMPAVSIPRPRPPRTAGFDVVQADIDRMRRLFADPPRPMRSMWAYDPEEDVTHYVGNGPAVTAQEPAPEPTLRVNLSAAENAARDMIRATEGMGTRTYDGVNRTRTTEYHTDHLPPPVSVAAEDPMAIYRDPTLIAKPAPKPKPKKRYDEYPMELAPGDRWEFEVTDGFTRTKLIYRNDTDAKVSIPSMVDGVVMARNQQVSA